jgi:hypothetical protein
MPPERSPLAVPGGHQPLLRPADQRRHQQRRQRQVILGLEREPHRRQQILHRQRRVQPQPVDARHRHPLGIEPRNDQRGEVAAPLDQDHDVLRLQPAALALQHDAIVQPATDRPRDVGRDLAHRIVDPAFLVLVAAARHDGRPERDAARPLHLTGVAFDFTRHPHAGFAQRLDRRVDKLQDRRGRTEAVGQRQLVERQAALFGRPFVVARHLVRAAREMQFGRLEVDRVGALEAEDRLFVIADRE